MCQMEISCLLLVVLCSISVSEGHEVEPSEPQCYSRFDYEYKVLQNLISLKTAEQELRQMITELQNTVRGLQDRVKDHKLVSFNVYLKNRVENGKLVSAVKFEHVSTNTGNGYDVHTGLFTAPAAGLYSFYARMSSPKRSNWYMMLNGETVGYLFTTGSHEKWESSSHSVSLKLDVGDKVWIDGEGTFEGYEPYNCSARVCYHSSFTGLLVQPD